MRPLLLAAIVAALGACSAATPRQGQPRVTLVTDSTQYTVRLVDGMYRARIGYTYTNRSGDAVSTNHCHTPPPPILEKRVGDGWVRAYSAVMLMCLTIPPFRIAAGETYRGTLDLAVAPRGVNAAPALEVDAIPGTYRLRWALRAGNDPDARDAPTVEAISNEFRLIER
jgi:hypothetical protein